MGPAGPGDIECSLDVQQSLVEASYRRDKRGELSAASRSLARARVLMRLSRALG